MFGDSLMRALLGNTPIMQVTSIQPAKASVPKPEYKGWMVAPWSREAASIHATTAVLSAPVWGSTKPNDFITISGMKPPSAPTVISVPTIAGSNIPGGGVNIP